MVSGPSGEVPRIFKPHFFEQENERLEISPELYQRIKETVQQPLDTFEKEVNEQVEDLLKQFRTNNSLEPSKAAKYIKQTQESVNRSIDSTISQISGLLHDSIGPGHEKAIGSFLEDIHNQMIQNSNVEQIVYEKHPSIRQPSLFGLASSTHLVAKREVAGGESNWSLNDAIKNINAWKQQNSTQPGDAAARLADSLIQSLQDICKNQGGENLTTALTGIDRFQILQKNGQDMYMQFYPLKGNQISNLINMALYGQSSPPSSVTPPPRLPPYTAMDEKYSLAQNLLLASSSPQDKALAQNLIDKIAAMGSLGNTNDLQSWAQHMVDDSQSTYWTASSDAQKQFINTSGATPIAKPNWDEWHLDDQTEAINIWKQQNSSQSGDGAARFAEDLIKAFEDIAQAHPEYNNTQLDKAVSNYFESNMGDNKQDIYMKYYPLQSGQISFLIKNVLGLNTTPSYTDMDEKYAAAQKFLQSATSAPDKEVAQNLIDGIATIGSFGTANSLQSWAQNMINDPQSSFWKASSGAQKQFLDLTGANGSPLLFFDAKIIQYLQQKETTYTQFLSSLGLSIANAPKSYAEWERLSKIDAKKADGLAESIRLAANNNNWQFLVQKYGLKPGSDAQIQQEANDRLNAYRNVLQGAGHQSAFNLFTQAHQMIDQLISKGGNVGDLTKWAQSINLANYPGMSQQDIAEFKTLIQ